jgi:hypothetical protein
MAEEDGIGVGKRGFVRDTWRGGGIREGGLCGGRRVIPFGPGNFSFSLSLLRKRNGLCVIFCGCVMGFEEEETMGTSVNGDALNDDWTPGSWGDITRGLTCKRVPVFGWCTWL